MPEFDYDLFVIGSGPSGETAAIQGAKLGKRVAVAERKRELGGVSVNTGTIPSKTLREAVLHLSGYREHIFHGEAYRLKQNIEMEDLLKRTYQVIDHEIDVRRHQMARNGIDLIGASAAFTGPHELRLKHLDGGSQRDVTTEFAVISTGSSPTATNGVLTDGQTVFTSDQILELRKLPKTLAVVGAGVIGCEYASIFAALGVRVTLIDKFDRLLPFADKEIVDSLIYQLSQHRLTMRLGEEVSGIVPFEDERGLHVKIELASGKQIIADKALYSIGRTGATRSLELESTGITPDERGRLRVNDHFQTEVPNIYAVGDVIGFPSLASTGMEQGRLAACHAFGVEVHSAPQLFPYGIYSIPEISTVGRNEEELTEQEVPYEVGKAYYREIARGQIIGDSTGLLKLLFHLETRELLGVHIIGEGASELIHIGQAVMAFGGTVDYFVDTVFNYPTLAECYKTAAFDGINRLGG